MKKNFEASVQVPAKIYYERLGLTNFINAYSQIIDCLRYNPEHVLIVGQGTGIEQAILTKFGVDVTVIDIDPALAPDVLGSVDNMSEFKEKQFDVVIASHVLEHLPFEFFEKSCREIARVGKYALLYLPIACIVPELTIAVQPLFNKTLRLRIPLFWKDHKFNGEHYWEIGTKGYSLNRVRMEISKVFTIVEDYHNWHWRYSYNFIVRS